MPCWINIVHTREARLDHIGGWAKMAHIDIIDVLHQSMEPSKHIIK